MKVKRRLKLSEYSSVFNSLVLFIIIITLSVNNSAAQSSGFGLELEQITTGKHHHFFGYIGQCKTIPWNANGRYILGLEIDTIDRMPRPGEPAKIILIDTKDNNKIINIDETHAWNPQQGTMFYWNPGAADTQFFFNDKDPETGEVYTVIYDIEKKKRIREFRYHDTPIGNGGVAPDGSAWLGLNYGRLARLRLVTGYPGALDWSKHEIAPVNDGIFIVDIQTGEKKLLVSYAQLDEKIKEQEPGLEHTGLFINHTLWNRESEMVYFFARAGWNRKGARRINIPFSIRADGTELALHEMHIGGHPEWADSSLIIGRRGKKQVLYDVVKKEVVGQLGNPEIFPDPEGDIALSPDGKWFVNGYKTDSENFYTVYRRSDGAYAKSEGIHKGAFSGNIRIDPAPRWNRTNDAILVPGIDDYDTRQMFILSIVPR